MTKLEEFLNSRDWAAADEWVPRDYTVARESISAFVKEVRQRGLEIFSDAINIGIDQPTSNCEGLAFNELVAELGLEDSREQ